MNFRVNMLSRLNLLLFKSNIRYHSKSVNDASLSAWLRESRARLLKDSISDVTHSQPPSRPHTSGSLLSLGQSIRVHGAPLSLPDDRMYHMTQAVQHRPHMEMVQISTTEINKNGITSNLFLDEHDLTSSSRHKARSLQQLGVDSDVILELVTTCAEMPIERFDDVCQTIDGLDVPRDLRQFAARELLSDAAIKPIERYPTVETAMETAKDIMLQCERESDRIRSLRSRNAIDITA